MLEELLNSWYYSDLSKCTIIFTSIVYTIYNINKMITDEKYSKRPMICYVSTFALTSITSPYIGAAIGALAPISFPIILGINHYPIFMKKIKLIGTSNMTTEVKEEESNKE